MKLGLIGYTGFVGSNLINQTNFDSLYNSSNINEIDEHEFDALFIAAPSAAKWKANQEPEQDLRMINDLVDRLKRVKSKRVVQLSTIDVYKNPVDVNENTPVDLEGLHPYGTNRFYLEEFIRKNFDNHLIIRLPALFGNGLKKNFIFDLLNNNCLDMTHKDSCFQFYNLENLWKDINIALKRKISLLNVATQPISTKEAAKKAFNVNFNNVTEKDPVFYDFRSVYSKYWGGENGYLYQKEQILKDLKKFVKSQK